MTVNVSVHYGVDAEVLAWIARTPPVDLPALLRWHARRVAAVEALRIVVDSLR